MIFRFLVWLLSKMDKGRLEGLNIDSEEVSFKIKLYVPEDGKWHHCAATVDFWLKCNDKAKKEKFYVDGVMVITEDK